MGSKAMIEASEVKISSLTNPYPDDAAHILSELESISMIFMK